MEAEWRREARRREVLPVPPVRRIVMVGDDFGLFSMVDRRRWSKVRM